MPVSINSKRRVCVAPMMDWTDRHCRYFLRLISRHAWLYTEMVTTGAILHGDRDRFLAYSDIEHPLALQLGGSDPQELAECARIAQDYGYDEVNLNVGCPSDRVQSGRFGACLMKDRELVSDCIGEMSSVVDIPVTVKTRIGVDEHDSEALLLEFVSGLVGAGCSALIVHARKAWLSGLSPKQNRTVPPLDYGRVYAVAHAFPELELVVNGGVSTVPEIERQLECVDGVMLGRAAYHTPWLLSEVDERFYGAGPSVKTRESVLQNFSKYLEEAVPGDRAPGFILRHVLGIYQGQPGARIWRRYLSERMFRSDADIDLLERSLEIVRDHSAGNSPREVGHVAT